MTGYFKELQTAMRAALVAGSHFAQAVNVSKQVSTKSSPADLVTEYDRECEDMIRSMITETFPDHAILGEETTAPGSAASSKAAAAVCQSPHLWIVDPLDGTTNFVYQLPLSVVSIAYAEEGKVRAGVIYDPYRKELFAACEGQEAVKATSEEAEQWLNESVLKKQGNGGSDGGVCESGDVMTLPGVAISASRRETVRGAVLATGFPPRTQSRRQAVEATLQLTEYVKNLRALGAAALHLAYVAAGRLDGFWEYDLNAWDLAAGSFLIQQARGSVKTIDGSPYNLLTRDVVAAGTENLIDDIIRRVAVDV